MIISLFLLRFPLGALLGLAILSLAGCVHQTSAELPEGAETLDDLPEGESWDAELRMSEGDQMRLALSAPYLARYVGDTAYVYLGPDPATPDSASEDVSVRLYDDTGELTATITSEEARYEEQSEELVAEGRVRAEVSSGGGASITAARLRATRDGAFSASGGATADLKGDAQATIRAQRISGSEGGGRYEASGRVVVNARSGRRLDAGQVIWDEDAGQFRAPGAFTFDGPGQRVRGVGLVASADLSRYSFRRASGQIEVQE
ncbi:MAG: hypothetical protein Rubg2KO_20100 [Rubricoccaceae bacterium]